MTSEERRAREFCAGLGYFEGSTAEYELVGVLKDHAKEQREACADKFDFEEEQLLCLNATGERNDE